MSPCVIQGFLSVRTGYAALLAPLWLSIVVGWSDSENATFHHMV
ncbi:hypothetical protein PUN4_330152 [Paraburkholderia unamae]|nr:hypothetical protein PUN4_330152 [Paraburkholderia unamae]